MKNAAKVSHSLKVGDMLRAVWGWEQTNVNFFQVKKVTAKSVVIQEVKQERVYSDQLSGECYPKKDQFMGDEMRRVVRSDGKSVKIEDWGILAHVMDENCRNGAYFSQYA